MSGEHAMARIAARLQQAGRQLEALRLVDSCGRVTRVVGPLVEAAVPAVKIGEMCEIGPIDGAMVLMEVVGFHQQGALLSPFGPLQGVGPGMRVWPLARRHRLAVGSHLVGRMLDGFGNADGALAPALDALPVNVRGDAPAPQQRTPIDRPVPTGVRAIDGFLTLCRGQRIGVFAGPGCGKSTLMQAIARHVDVDVVVMALIGERGRELAEMTEVLEDPVLRRKLVIVGSTSDRAAAERIRAAYTATAIAEGFRDQGKNVLLMVDSLTRFARAVRETAVAAGEHVGRSGMPASVYAELPRLLERAGNAGGGSITALYFVLVEGSVQEDPIADEVRSIVDGHIILRRELADKGVFPAISVLESLSRVMSGIVPREHMQAARQVRKLLAKYEEIELLLKLGEIKPGMDPDIDAAVAAYPEIMQYLQQDISAGSTLEESVAALQNLAGRFG